MAKVVLDVTAAAFALLAAYYWLRSAATPMPAPITYCDFTPARDPFLTAVRTATRLNRLAATFAAMSALAAAGASIVADFPAG